jgi:ribonuclease HIII
MQRLKWTIPPSQRQAVKRALLELGQAAIKTEQSCDYRLDYQGPGVKVIAKQFSNGTLYVEGQDSPLLQRIQTIINGLGDSKTVGKTSSSSTSGPSSETKSRYAKPTVNTGIQLSYPYIGQDESGKGDYFGAPVVAGVVLNQDQEAALKQAGVRDSKDLSPAQITSLARVIKSLLPPEQIHVLSWSVEDYNSTYESFKAKGKSLNHLLGKAHADVYTALTTACPDTSLAIIDQFSVSDTIGPAVGRHKPCPIEQTPKAEAYTAVAAASIIARDVFVTHLKDLEAEFGLRIPLGAANGIVIPAGQAVVRQYGEAGLRRVAKLHFKTTESVLGL